jgi:hypothetical protein
MQRRLPRSLQGSARGALQVLCYDVPGEDPRDIMTAGGVYLLRTNQK